MKLFLLFLTICVIHAERVVIHTWGHHVYNFFPLCTNYLEFNAMAPREVHIILSNSFAKEMGSYEFAIGGWNNTRSVIRKDGKEKVVLDGTLVEGGVYQKYWVSVNDTSESVSVGMQYGKPLMTFNDPNYVKMSYFGMASGKDQFITWDFDYKMLKCPWST